MSALLEANKSELISAASRKEIDHWISKYPPDQKQSAVIASLRIVQEQNGGWLSTELMDAVADYLDMTSISVYEVATFYSMFHMQPGGRHRLSVCTNISCLLCGSDDVVAHLKNKLGITFGETTEDGKFTLEEVECLCACIGAPVMQIGKQYYENLTPAKIDEILDTLE